MNFTGLSSSLAAADDDLIGYLSSEPSLSLQVRSLKKVWSQFKNSNFWKKYKLTQNGKELQQSIDSISASFLIIGLTFDDLLEIFSDDSLLALWVQYNHLSHFLYLIPSNKNILQFIERLEYFSVANKINYSTYTVHGVEVKDFAQKIFIAKVNQYVLISDNKMNLEGTLLNIVNKSQGTKPDLFFESQKEDEIIIRNNISQSILYRFSFRDRLIFETLSKDSSSNTNYFDDVSHLKFVPSNVNFISFSENLNNLKNMYYPFFQSLDTNIINLDISYFDAFFQKGVFPPGSSGILGIKLTDTSTNIIMIIPAMGSNFIMGKNEKATYYNIPLYEDTSAGSLKYVCLYQDILLLSNNLSYLKQSIHEYKKSKSFYFTKEKNLIMSQWKVKKNTASFFWIDLEKYIISKSFAHKNEKWLFYNAYHRSFARLIHYGFREKDNYYTILKSYTVKK
ncbi:MAG: hypothetical protein JW827_06705 [Spirochaetes bacterium]|nr:hypothetical protein [Spirochaetota bacterium]